MTRNNILPKLFVIISVLWIFAFLYLYIRSINMQKQIDFIEENYSELESLPYYKRSIEKLQRELTDIEWESFSGRPLSEFVVLLPKMAEKSKIETLKIENTETRIENEREVTELQISAVSSFSKIASFIDLLERSRLPIQINSLGLEENNGKIKTSMSLRIFKPAGTNSVLTGTQVE